MSGNLKGDVKRAPRCSLTSESSVFMFMRTWIGIETSSSPGDNGFVCRDESHDATDHGNSN
jgi:hypothetical protein